MAKKSTKKASKKPGKPKLKPFELRFFLEGGTSVWMNERAESRAALVARARKLLEGPGRWLVLDAHTGVMHVRREKVVGFVVEDLTRPDLIPVPVKEDIEKNWSKIILRLDDDDFCLEDKG